MDVKFRIASILAGASLITGSIFLISACGGGDSSSAGSVAAAGGGATSYAGPGSRWDVSLDGNGAFTITMKQTQGGPDVLDIAGSYQELPSGFLKMTVTSASSTDPVNEPAPNTGDAAYALNVPGYVFVLKPIAPNSDQIVPMVASGTCPTSDLDANWVLVKMDQNASAADVNNELYGTFHYNAASSQASLPARYHPSNTGSTGSFNLSAGVCSAGVMVVNNEAEMYLTTSGGAIVRTGFQTPNDDTDDSFIYAFSRQAIGNTGNLQGTYAGLLYDGNAPAGSRNQPVSVSCDAAGSCTGALLTDIDNNLVSTQTVTITLGTADIPSDGLVAGTITEGASNGGLACAVNINAQGSGRNVVSCVGQSPQDNTQLFNILMVSS